MEKCSSINHPNLTPGWGCCQCRTFNGNNRDACKACNHDRCDNPALKSVPVQDERGVMFIPVRADKHLMN